MHRLADDDVVELAREVMPRDSVTALGNARHPGERRPDRNTDATVRSEIKIFIPNGPWCALGEWHARSAHRLADSAVVAGTGFRAGDWLTFLVERYFGLVGNHSG
jgi:hypothetical protein